MTWHRRMAPVLSILSVTWCVAIGFVIWFTPVRYSGTHGGVPVVIDRHFSDVSGNGALPLVIPVLIAVLGAWGAWHGRRLILAVSTFLLLVFTVISGFSIGGAYLMADALQLLATGLAAWFGTGRLRSSAA